VTVDGADMTVGKSHTGDFAQGDKGRAYSLVARNIGNMPSSGPVSVTDALPTGLTATGITGNGWSCNLATLSCTRSDALAPGASYPPIIVTVDVANDAPAAVINSAKVSHAGENTENDEAGDRTTIATRQPDPQPDPQPEPGTGGDQPSGDTPSGDGPRDQGPIGSQTGNDTPPRDLTAPAFGSLRMTNRKFAVNPKGGVSAARAKKGTAFVYALSEPARVVVSVERKSAGRRSRWVRAGSFAQNGGAGANNQRWAGSIGTKALKPGAYRASIVATDAAGNKSAARRLSFRIVRR
jgi:uncharacterized repeat protein (TIGR01451 family)